MTLTPTSGIETKSNTITKLEFINLVNSKPTLNLNARDTKVVIEETITVEPSKLAIAMIHRVMSDADRVKAIEATTPTRSYRIHSVGDKITDLKVDRVPLIDWSMTMAIKRFDMLDTVANLITVSAALGNLSYADRTDITLKNKPLVITEYLMCDNHAVMGYFDDVTEG